MMEDYGSQFMETSLQRDATSQRPASNKIRGMKRVRGVGRRV